MKRVLLIAFDFPPRRTSGVYRPTGLTKYLVRLGWEPTVLTVRTRAGDVEDPTLLERVPAEVRVVRTGYLRLSRWEESTVKVARRGGALPAAADRDRWPRVGRLLRRLGNFVRSCVYFPDEAVGWGPFGLGGAIRLTFED